MLLFAVPWKLLAVLGLDVDWVVLLVPGLVQACVAALGDLALYRVAVSWFGASDAKWSLLLHVSTWSVWYCMARTLSNSLESTLVLCVLWCLTTQRLGFAVVLMVSCVFVRPSSVVYWASWAAFQPLASLISLLPIGIATAASATLLDSWWFGRIVLTPFNLVWFNVVSSSFYGTHPWFWYLSSGLPTLIASWSPVVVVGSCVLLPQKLRWVLVCFVLAPLALLSLLPHKEFRFLLPSASVLLLLSGPALARLWRWRKSVCVILIVTNAVMAGYFSLVHQAGPMAATEFLRSRAKPFDQICYVTPCHSLPEHAHLRIPRVRIRTLECDPPLSQPRESASDRFFAGPSGEKMDLLLSEWKCDWIVAFEPIASLISSRAQLVFEAHHAHFPSDRRHGHSIAVFRQENFRLYKRQIN
jgi:phosphatidylinositol glycan class B